MAKEEQRRVELAERERQLLQDLEDIRRRNREDEMKPRVEEEDQHVVESEPKPQVRAPLYKIIVRNKKDV